jgi:hypothetical protein
MAVPLALGAEEICRGSLKLVIHRDTGRFSLYALSEEGWYTALWTTKDPRTSFLTILLDGRPYRMGETSLFRSVPPGDPLSLVFESSSVRVTCAFAFVSTPGAGAANATANAIEMTVTIENRGSRTVEAGASFLLDTSLGERPNQSHFEAGGRPIFRETVVQGTEGITWWSSRKGKTVLTGSIGRGDRVIFGNWKRLSERPWEEDYRGGRNFSFAPWSVDDSAVCYLFDPTPLPGGAARSFSLVLAAGEIEPGEDGRIVLKEEDPLEEFLKRGKRLEDLSREEALSLVREMIDHIDIAGGTMSEKEYDAMESLIRRLKMVYQ